MAEVQQQPNRLCYLQNVPKFGHCLRQPCKGKRKDSRWQIGSGKGDRGWLVLLFHHTEINALFPRSWAESTLACWVCYERSCVRDSSCCPAKCQQHGSGQPPLNFITGKRSCQRLCPVEILLCKHWKPLQFQWTHQQQERKTVSLVQPDILEDK